MNIFKLLNTASDIYRSVTGRSAMHDAMQKVVENTPKTSQKVTKKVKKKITKPVSSSDGIGKTNLSTLKKAIDEIESDGQITSTEIIFLHEVISGLGLNEAEYQELVVDNLMKRFSQMIVEDDKVSLAELQAYNTFGKKFGFDTFKGGKFEDDFSLRMRVMKGIYDNNNATVAELPEIPSHILSDEELADLPTFTTLEEALTNPEKVVKADFQGQRFEYDFADDKIELLTNLQVLNIADTNITRVKFDISKLTKLTHFDMSDNPDVEFEPTLAKLHHCKYLRELNLSGINLVSLPTKISTLEYLEDVDLSYNLLMTLDQSFREWKSIWFLNLSHNENLDFDALVAALRNRKSSQALNLDLDNCNLKSIPQELRLVKNIEKLDLSSNQISTFPNMFEEIEGLDLLILNENPFFAEEISEFQAKMPKTTILFDNLELLKKRMGQ